MKTKQHLFDAGLTLISNFCEYNRLGMPEVQTPERWGVSSCAYYRPIKIVIHLSSCAHIGTCGQAWSYPGYFIDRTPYGVLAHELGHHADWTKGSRKGAYFSDFSVTMRAASGEPKLTNYCPNDAEWFAEMFRLFITNPDLLMLIRPKTFHLICEHFKPVELRPWRKVLEEAPERNIEQCLKRAAMVEHPSLCKSTFPHPPHDLCQGVLFA